jgi:dTDP-4-dehydrorhamnose reductase
MKRILLTGSNGLIGRQIVNDLLRSGDAVVCGISSGENRNSSKGFHFERADITQYAVMSEILNSFKPDAIIHTAAMGSPDKCEENRAEAWKVNVEATSFLAEFSRINHIYLLHWSTDFVFDGLKGYYSEDDEPNPVSYYGLTKLESEKAVLDLCPAAAVFRTMLVYGLYKEMTRPNILSRVLDCGKENRMMNVAADQYRMPTLVNDLACAVKTALVTEPAGIFHVSGNEYVSVYDFVLRIAGAFSISEKLFVPVLSSDLNEKAVRPKKTGFVLTKAMSELSYVPTPVNESLQKIKQIFGN